MPPEAAGPGGEDCAEVLPAPGERRFRFRRFPFRARSGKLYIAGIGADVTPLTGEESARHSLSVLTDAEARCERLFESELFGVMECSEESVIDANDALLGWLGYSSDQLARMNWRDLTPARYRPQDDAAVAEVRSSGSCRPYEKELIHSNGSLVPVLVSATEIQPRSGSFLCFVLNISERRQMEERLLRSQKLESLGLIAGGVAHDFNNLLATIMGNGSLCLDAISREHPAFKPLSEIVLASRRASDLTQQVLAYSGRANFQIRPVDLSIAVREIGSLLETTISKKINLKFHLASGLPFIDADEGQLQQVIMNLVINASDAIGEQPGTIAVITREIRSIDQKPDQGRSVCFEVRDTGCGMTEATKARIFDPFFTTKADGRGLGLAAVLGIVKNHGGALLVESEPGAGTSFRIVFPAGQSQPAASRQAHAREELWGSETVLVVDDDEGIRRMTRAALERYGYEVLLAANGQEAVDIFSAHKDEIAVVLLDWAMPVMNGDEALKRILAVDPSAKILMSSGYAETETLQRVGTPLLAGFVQKPYTTTQLAESLRAVIDGRHL